jgi:hypothetical protein
LARTLKKIAFLAIAVFLAGRSLAIIDFLLRTSPLQLGHAQALFLNLCIAGVFAFPGFVFPTSSLLGDWYYRVRRPQALQRLYAMLGVDYFRSLVIFFLGHRPQSEEIFRRYPVWPRWPGFPG